jgi:hypothetical protein
MMRLPAILFAIVILLFIIMMTGCSTTVPVTSKFPEVPDRLLEKCPNLQKLHDDSKLSDITKTVAINYTTYYECAVKNDAWIEWYQIQKHIYESVK